MLPESPPDAGRLDYLEDKLALLVDFALAHEKWEARVLTDGGPWVDEMIDEEFQHVQYLRCQAMARKS